MLQAIRSNGDVKLTCSWACFLAGIFSIGCYGNCLLAVYVYRDWSHYSLYSTFVNTRQAAQGHTNAHIYMHAVGDESPVTKTMQFASVVEYPKGSSNAE